MKFKIKIRLISWGALIIVIILGFLCSCEPTYIKPKLSGLYESENVSLDFKDSIFYAITCCNTIEGQYYTFSQDSIRLKIGWKKSVNNEFNIMLLCDNFKYEIKGCRLILKGNDFEIIMYRIK